MCKRRQWPHHCSGASHRRKFLRHDVEGRANGAGTIFRIALGLAPFVKTVQAAGKAGDPIIILGNNLTGSTGVTFNGTAATFSGSRPLILVLPFQPERLRVRFRS